jgi:hypothetical protein
LKNFCDDPVICAAGAAGMVNFSSSINTDSNQYDTHSELNNGAISRPPVNPPASAPVSLLVTSLVKALRESPSLKVHA